MVLCWLAGRLTRVLSAGCLWRCRFGRLRRPESANGPPTKRPTKHLIQSRSAVMFVWVASGVGGILLPLCVLIRMNKIT